MSIKFSLFLFIYLMVKFVLKVYFFFVLSSWFFKKQFFNSFITILAMLLFVQFNFYYLLHLLLLLLLFFLFIIVIVVVVNVTFIVIVVAVATAVVTIKLFHNFKWSFTFTTAIQMFLYGWRYEIFCFCMITRLSQQRGFNYFTILYILYFLQNIIIYAICNNGIFSVNREKQYINTKNLHELKAGKLTCILDDLRPALSSKWLL